MSSKPPTPDPSPGSAPRKRRAARLAPTPVKKIRTNDKDLPDESNSGRFLLFTVVPSWVVSLLAHIILILIAAFFVLPRPASRSVSFEGTAPTDSIVESVDISLDAFDEEPIETELAASAPMEIVEPTEALAPEATVDVGTIMAGLDSSLEFDSQPSESITPSLGNHTSLRTGTSRGEALKKNGGTAGSESAVKLALKWIVDHQLPDGGWHLNHQLGPGKRTSPDPGTMSSKTPARNAATALALLPLLGHGNTHKSGQYQSAVLSGVQFLMQNARPAGKGISFYEPGGTMYSHGLATIALCELYAMTKDPELQPFAQKAVYYIEETQNAKTDGGWGYGNSRHRPAHASDTSIVGWQLMALKSAISSGLKVQPRTIKLTNRFLIGVESPKTGMFGYSEKINTPSRRYRGCTSIGALSRMYLGAEKDSDEIRKPIELLDRWGPDNDSTGKQVTDMYYNYYATQAMKQYGGEKWKRWNDGLRDYLVEQQEREGPAAGSWMFDERHSVKAGRLYATSLACMTLEVYYRFMPLYKESILDEEFPL